MKVIFKDLKKGILKLKIENSEDLWYLNYIIEKGDFLKSFTFRKIKLGNDSERDAKIIKKPVVITIEVEKVEFSKYTNVLRVSGIIKEAPEDIPLGSHHTINIEENSEFVLEKKEILKYQLEKLNEAETKNNEKILICVHDRDEAIFAILKKYGYDIVLELKGNSQKKADMKIDSKDFFKDIKENLEEYDKRYNLSSIVVASPGFWKDYIEKELKNSDLKNKVIYATCSSVGINGINEVIKRDEIKIALKKEKFAKETEKVELLLKEISISGKAEYGLKNVEKAINLGAVNELLISDDFLLKKRQEEDFYKIEELMKLVEKMNGSITIISSEHEAGQKLNGLGGIAALLRYKINY
ncbi:MAG: mRNA surveillance protein pelota [Candidatus Woesearchaeota archaeon]